MTLPLPGIDLPPSRGTRTETCDKCGAVSDGPFEQTKLQWVLVSRYEPAGRNTVRVRTRLLCPRCGQKAWEVAGG